MMISAPSAGDPYAAAAALDRQLRTPTADSSDDASDSGSPDASPDVVVTLSSGSSSPSTYNAAGKLAGTPTLDDMGANASDSLAHASESVTDDTAPDDGTAAAASANANANVDEDSAVPA
jgi:hypothetical protein